MEPFSNDNWQWHCCHSSSKRLPKQLFKISFEVVHRYSFVNFRADFFYKHPEILVNIGILLQKGFQPIVYSFMCRKMKTSSEKSQLYINFSCHANLHKSTSAKLELAKKWVAKNHFRKSCILSHIRQNHTNSLHLSKKKL